MTPEQSLTASIEQTRQTASPVNGTSETPVLLPRSDWRTVPYWFAALAGFVYSTGFLVDFTYLATMGIKDPLTEVVKARHIYVGLLCLQLPISLCVAVLGFVRYIAKAKSEAAYPKYVVRRMLPSLLSVILLLFAFYMLIAFSRQGSSYVENQFAVASLFVLGILGLVFARGIEDKVEEIGAKYPGVNDYLKNSHTVTNAIIAIRWLVLALVFGLTVYIFRHLWLLIGVMLWEGAYLYVGLFLMVGLMLWRLDKRSADFAKMGLRATMVGITLALALAFLYFAILVFAARIYPFIPAGRGGCDYTTESPSILIFDSKFRDALPKELIDDSAMVLRSKPLYILRDTSQAIFVAIPTNEDKGNGIYENGPLQWRKLGRENKPRALFSIKREAVLCTQYENE